MFVITLAIAVHQFNKLNKRYPYIGNPFGFKLPEKPAVIHPIITKWRELSEEDKMFLLDVKNVIVETIGECKVSLYGSRIKGYWREDSDYDLKVYKLVDTETRKLLSSYPWKYKIDLSFSIPEVPEIGVEIP